MGIHKHKGRRNERKKLRFQKLHPGMTRTEWAKVKKQKKNDK
jgi:hypothetical protein